VKITNFGVNSRPHVIGLQDEFIKSFPAPSPIEAGLRDDLCPDNLGKNWSGIVLNSGVDNLLMLLDCDDGGWQTPDNFKLDLKKLRDVIIKYKISDLTIFKLQLLEESERTSYIPDLGENIFPIGLMTHQSFYEFSDRLIKVYSEERIEKDIDVFFAGGRIFDENIEKNYHNKMKTWPKDQPRDRWFSLVRQRGYNKLLEIKEKRRDLNIVCEDYGLDQVEYLDLVMRSKICVGFPGIGKGSRKFHEFLVLGKCALSLRQQLNCWNISENIHYLSLGDDYNFDTLEEVIVSSLSDKSIISQIEKNCVDISKNLTYKHAVEYMIKSLNASHLRKNSQEVIDRILDQSIQKEWEKLKQISIEQD